MQEGGLFPKIPQYIIYIRQKRGKRFNRSLIAFKLPLALASGSAGLGIQPALAEFMFGLKPY
ncbi:MAG TPA: hypothetical protein VGO50_18725 [Pyrinomonadaceae bacterium]|jgi:hypothetical protein|nr:hypothetical protein [Pyrinomonadaceae bacterium]